MPQVILGHLRFSLVPAIPTRLLRKVGSRPGKTRRARDACARQDNRVRVRICHAHFRAPLEHAPVPPHASVVPPVWRDLPRATSLPHRPSPVATPHAASKHRSRRPLGAGANRRNATSPSAPLLGAARARHARTGARHHPAPVAVAVAAPRDPAARRAPARVPAPLSLPASVPVRERARGGGRKPPSASRGASFFSFFLTTGRCRGARHGSARARARPCRAAAGP
jgi:hypothetical protein